MWLIWLNCVIIYVRAIFSQNNSGSIVMIKLIFMLRNIKENIVYIFCSFKVNHLT